MRLAPGVVARPRNCLTTGPSGRRPIGFYDFYARFGVVAAADLVAWRRVSLGTCEPFLDHVTTGLAIGTRPVKLRVSRRLQRR